MILLLATVLAVARIVLGQTSANGVLDATSWVSGYGALGLVTFMFLTDRIKTKQDLERAHHERDEAEQLRNEALDRERETLERVIPLVVASNELVARMAARHLEGDGGQ